MLKASIPDFPNYDIYIDGRVVNNKTGKELKHTILKTGYLKVSLCKNGKSKIFTIHRLLGQCFMVYNCDFKNITIDHIDRNRLNNKLSNLRLADYFTQNSNQHLRKTNKLGERNISISTKKSIRPYIFQIIRHGLTDRQSFETLEEAIRYRDQYYED